MTRTLTVTDFSTYHSGSKHKELLGMHMKTTNSTYNSVQGRCVSTKNTKTVPQMRQSATKYAELLRKHYLGPDTTVFTC